MTDTETTPAYTRRFWAKSEPRDGHPKSIHLLEHHLADVGACFEALLNQPTIRQRLARSGGMDALDDTTAARLSLLAALHDIGKVNVGFQTRIWRNGDHRNGRRPAAFGYAGHYNELAPVLTDEDRATADWFFDHLGLHYEVIRSWDDRDGDTVCALFVAALSHHGQPLQLEDNKPSNRALWERYGNLTPAEEVRRIGDMAHRWFSTAGNEQTLPSRPQFQHHFLGLCTLADWIGSNERWFKYLDEPDEDYIVRARRQAQKAIKDIGLNVSEQRAAFGAMPPRLGFASLFGHPAPNAIQQAALDTPLEEPLVIIESETGSGKTEAALWRFARMYEAGLVDGLYFALPTRAAAVQLHRRVSEFAARLFPQGHCPPVVLAVPGYRPGADAEEVALQIYDSHAAGHEDSHERPWAAESSKRYLAAQIAVGTVDQAMMAALKVRHAHMRSACLSRNLLVVDEVHASDPYMRRILKALLDAHLGAGGHALLMSATLGSVARQEWLAAGRFNADDAMPLGDAADSPYPAVSVRAGGGGSISDVGGNSQDKTVGISAELLIHDFAVVAERALRAARDGAKVLVIRNTVTYAVDTFQAVETAAQARDAGLLFAVAGKPTLHHSRFAPDDRRLLDGEAEERLGKEREAGGIVIVGTQTLEQSLDIDADLLITDLCPVDVLLQRVGRLRRHQRGGRPAGYAEPRCVVLTPDGDGLSPLLQRSRNLTGLGPHGYVYADLRVLEATRRLMGQYTEWRIPQMNRLLVEKATHPDVLAAIVAELGDAWREHANNVLGGQLAEGLTAANAIVRRDKSFFSDNREVLFGSDEERIRTRLGDEGVEVEFDPPPPSPFDGQPVRRMPVPARWLTGAEVPEAVEPSSDGDGGFTFAVAGRAFRYDRLGLRRG